MKAHQGTTAEARDSIYWHMHAQDPFRMRQRNMRCALEQIIERGDRTPVSGWQIVSAINAYLRLSTAGQGNEPTQDTNSNEVFERSSKEEREAFLRHGSLPE